MYKQFYIILFILFLVLGIQAQKLASIEKKVFNHLIKNVNAQQVTILSYCLDIELKNANITTVKQALIETSKSAALKKSFYTNANQFDTTWFNNLLNPVVKQNTGQRILSNDEYALLHSEINKYPYQNSSDVSVLKQKVYHYYECILQKSDSAKGIDIQSIEYKTTLRKNLYELIDSGQIAPSLIQNYYYLGFHSRANIHHIVNPYIYSSTHLFNNNEATILYKAYSIKPQETKCNCNDILVSSTEAAAFNGGEAELFRYIRNNVFYPVYEKEAGISGRVLVRFVVDKDGKVCDVEVVKKVSPGIDKEAKRVIESMPNWIPAKNNNKSVCIYYNMPISFTLSK